MLHCHFQSPLLQIRIVIIIISQIGPVKLFVESEEIHAAVRLDVRMLFEVECGCSPGIGD